MSVGPLRALTLDLNFDWFGVPATVTRPDDETPIATTVLWLTHEPYSVPGGVDFQRQEPQRVMAVRRDEVLTVPRGTRITAPATPGDDDAGWIVDGLERQEADHNRVFVVADPDWEPEVT